MPTLSPEVVKVANKVRLLREEQFLSQRELATMAGISPTTVVKLEAGGDAQRRTVRKIAAALEVSPRDLIDED